MVREPVSGTGITAMARQPDASSRRSMAKGWLRPDRMPDGLRFSVCMRRKVRGSNARSASSGFIARVRRRQGGCVVASTAGRLGVDENLRRRAY
jgi:hypothetical protein